MLLKTGEVLAFKTDTVWGFGCNPDDDLAIDKIYKIKNRDTKKPLILMSNDFSHLKKYIKKIPDYAYDLIEKYLPGGLTLIFEKSDFCSYNITSNNNTVGVRIPNSKDFSFLIDELNCKVLATTSCNISSEEPVKNYNEAVEKFGKIATIIKPIDDIENENMPSTVILCEDNTFKVLRQGIIKL
jgi:L-threonylcarbamoyladenylate synthase